MKFFKGILTLFSLFFFLAVNAQQTLLDTTYGGSYSDWPPALLSTPTGIVVVGIAFSADGDVLNNHGPNGTADAWIYKVDDAGNILWQKTIGGSLSDGLNTIIVSSDNNYILGGSSESNDGDIPFNSGSSDGCVAKLDTNGNILWLKTYGSIGFDYLHVIREAADGSLYVIGGGRPWLIKLDASGNLLWSKYLTAGVSDRLNSMIIAPNGNLLLCGQSRNLPNNNGSLDYWLLETDTSGTILRQKGFGGTSNEYDQFLFLNSSGLITGVCYTESNDLDVSGNHGGEDVWVFTLDSSWNILTQRCIGGSLNDDVYAAYSSNGQINICGVASSVDGDVIGHPSPAGDIDAWWVRTDMEGNILNQQCYGTTGTESISAYTDLPNGEFALGGNKNDDIWLLKKKPGLNHITGQVYYDKNGNNILDINDLATKGIGVKILNGITNFSNSQGRYLFQTESGTFNTTLQLPFGFMSIPDTATTIFPGSSVTDTIDFLIQPTATFSNLQIDIIPLNIARPGDTVCYKVVYRNVGTTTINETIAFTYDTASTYLSAQPNFTTHNGNTISWAGLNLEPLQSQELNVCFALDSFPLLQVGDTLRFSGKISDQSNILLASKDIIQLARYSYDPNDKTVIEGSTVTDSTIADTTWLSYNIRFQNTGTDTAFTVEIRDTLHPNVLWNTFTPLASSHADPNITITHERNVSIKYNGIQLPAASTDSFQSMGYFSYKIMVDPSLVVDDSINNTASIYFDANFPVITNTATTIVIAFPIDTIPTDTIPDDTTGLQVITEEPFKVYPNPTNGERGVYFDNRSVVELSLALYSLDGKLAESFTLKPGVNYIQLSAALTSGMYYYNACGTGKIKVTGKLLIEE